MPEIFGAALMGGGSGPAFAAIGVTYPAGAACTCSNGSKVLTAPDTTGHWLAIIPSAGEWTVTITQAGKEPKSATVSVTESKAYVVTISFWDGAIYNAGNEYTDITGGWEFGAEHTATYLDYQNQSGKYTKTKNPTNITMSGSRSNPGSFVATVTTKNPIDLTTFSTLNLQASVSTYGGETTFPWNTFLCVTSVPLSEQPAVSSSGLLKANQRLTNGTSQVYSLDISSIDSGHISVVNGAYGNSTVSTSLEIQKVWLE